MPTCCCRSGKLFKCYNDGSALRVTTFETAEITANPNGNGISGIPNINNANYSGLAPMNITGNPPGQVATGVEMDLGFVNPRDGIMQVRIANNWGNILNDFDGWFDPTVQFFDPLGAPLTAPFVAAANNGGAFFVTPVPGAPINNVARIHVSNIRGLQAGTSGIRELELLSLGIGPAALVYCPQDDQPLSWVDPRTGATIDPNDLVDCR
jgi:hypothetical protein